MKGSAEDPYIMWLAKWQADLIEQDKGVPVQQAVDEFFRVAVKVVVV